MPVGDLPLAVLAAKHLGNALRGYLSALLTLAVPFMNPAVMPDKGAMAVAVVVFPTCRVGYHQIAWFTKSDGTSLLQGLTYWQRAGSFDFIPHVLRGQPQRALLAHFGPLPAMVRIPAPMTGQAPCRLGNDGSYLMGPDWWVNCGWTRRVRPGFRLP
jgi:hypothetical protein